MLNTFLPSPLRTLSLTPHKALDFSAGKLRLRASHPGKGGGGRRRAYSQRNNHPRPTREEVAHAGRSELILWVRGGSAGGGAGRRVAAVGPTGRAPSFILFLPPFPRDLGVRGVGSRSLRQIALLGNYSPRFKTMPFNWLRVINESWCADP